ncbi:MAG: hypothetical protein ACFFB3_10335 [Candidatus Hodarchaeota archaeon]
MAKSSYPDFPFRFPFLLIETLVVSLLIGLAITTFNLMDEAIFIIEGALLVLLALCVRFFFAKGSIGAKSEGTAVRDDMDKMDTGILSVKVRRMKKSSLEAYRDSRSKLPFQRSEVGFEATEEVVSSIWKAFLLAAVGLLLFAGYESEHPLIRHYGQWAFIWVILFAAYIGVFLGFLHLLRNPRVAVSRIFDVYINLGALLLGIPFSIFFLFLIGAVTILIFVPAGANPQHALIPFVIVVIFIVVVAQIFYIVSTMNRYAAERGLSLSGYIRLKLSREEREREKLVKLAHRERMDSLYEKIPEIKERIHPAVSKSPAAYPVRSLEDYEYPVEEKNPILAFIREFIPALMGIIIANTLLILGFFALAALVWG